MTATSTGKLGSLIRRRGRHRKPAATAKILSAMTTFALLLALLLLIVIGYGIIDNRWYKVVAIEGRSMSPALNLGDMAFFGRPTEVQVGDIALFQVDGSVVTHRVVDIEPDGSYVTRGDANPSTDRWGRTEAQLVGIYLFRIPGLGHLFGHGVSAYLTDSAKFSISVTSSWP